MPTQQRPNRVLTESSADQFYLIRQLTFQKLFSSLSFSLFVVPVCMRGCYELIEKMLIEQGVSNIDSRYTMNQIKARWSNNFHQLQVGINQGCNLSTILYCGFSNQIMEKTQAAKDQNGNSYKFALGFIDDIVVITTPNKIQQTINETIALNKEMHLEVNTEKCECTHPNFFNKSGTVNFLGQDFGKTAKPLLKQITDNLKKKFDGYAKQDIPNKDKLLLFCQCIVSVITDLSSMSRNTALKTSSFIKKLTSS
ncbi:Putative_reverse transcriptase/endonuclease [Hexamita inflata]|uniref:Reverse transcriptase/endonuclease n=1 Tax=Hexamita inflata TaxID=28002 RepID=A0AA86UH59_9EUKA|nr:Putative reverse transcriptase/endonuclease [Hexamita inflata]